MNIKSAKRYPLLFLASIPIFAAAQEPNPTASNMQQNQPQPEMRDGIAYYKIQVVDRNLPAIDYFHRSGSTHIGFEGTQLLPQARGEAKVTSNNGRTSIDANFEHLSPANGFGTEYLTYVLWAITPEGLFDFNKYSLKSEAREKLAKISGILLAYPDLKVQVEGYTDNIGSDEYNQELSEKRANSVRDYLISQNVTGESVTAEGYGKTNPIADNATSSGRAQNRRVELVVSGASIGIRQERPPASATDSHEPPAQTVTPAKPSLPQSVIPQ